MKPLGHQAISASAGSGKTFQLAHRYIRLLAMGVPPDRISALTFSRKAAAEIFDSIIEYLAGAARSPDAATVTAERIHMPALRTPDFLKLLRIFLHDLHRMHVGTLDSFIVGVVRAFPSELGISMDFQVMDAEGPEAADLRGAVLARIFNPAVADAKTQREFLEAFKQATFGKEEKTIGERFDGFVETNRRRYQMLGREDAWGREATVWPDGSPWLGGDSDGDRVTAPPRDQIPCSGLSDSARERWLTFVEAAAAFAPGSPWTQDVGYLFEKLITQTDDLVAGHATVALNRKQVALTGEQCALALRLVRHVVQTELLAAVERTRGAYRVLSLYTAYSEELSRRLGALTFEDAQYLLTESNTWSGGRLLSRSDHEAGRLYIDYRLDCKLDHWLLDEFQDTSDLQWSVLGNLADEVLQDADGSRSFFYVGDVKQAIYGWRGGNARLFGNILRAYGERIDVVPMNTSFRSCAPVIQTINAVFSDLGTVDLPPGAVDAWRGHWQDHTCQAGVVPDSGYTALLEPPSEGGKVKPTDEDRYRLTAALLRRIDPIRRGLSTAVLVRTNSSGRAVVDMIRRECPDLDVVHEGNATINDNPVVSVLLSLIRFAAHPGDTLAWSHVHMSPLSAYLRAAALTRDALPLDVLRSVHDVGFEGCLRTWGERLHAQHPLDTFSRARMDDLLRAAAAFDQRGRCDADTFLRYLDGYQISETSPGGAVRVMTVHQSKGLGFDVVLLPDLQGRSLATAGTLDALVARDPGTERPLWTLLAPRRKIAEHDPVLMRELTHADETSCFEDLCVLYVAMTRAKRALYMVTSFPGKSSVALNSAAVIKQRLTSSAKPVTGVEGCIDGVACEILHENGDPDWYVPLEPGTEEDADVSAPLVLPADFAHRSSTRRRFPRVEPSHEEDIARSASRLFEVEAADVLAFGSGIHALFEQILWLEDADVEALIEDWRRRSADSAEVQRDLCEQFRRAAASDDVRAALRNPGGDVVVWREKRFEVVLDGQWITGTFDRVVITRDRAGRPESATVVDYKSDRVSSPSDMQRRAEQHRPQLALYGGVLSHILSLPPDRVRLQLVFTRIGAVHELS